MQWQRATGDALGQRVTGNQFEDQHRSAALGQVLEAMDRRDVRVIERRQQARFAFEAGKALAVGGKRRRQHLQGDLSAQTRVMRAEHFAHAAGAETLLDDIRADVQSLLHDGVDLSPAFRCHTQRAPFYYRSAPR